MTDSVPGDADETDRPWCPQCGSTNVEVDQVDMTVGVIHGGHPHYEPGRFTCLDCHDGGAPALLADLYQLRTRLRSLEWVSVPGPVPDARCCPVPECGVAKGGRHAPTCWLAEAIGAERDAGN